MGQAVPLTAKLLAHCTTGAPVKEEPELVVRTCGKEDMDSGDDDDDDDDAEDIGPPRGNERGPRSSSRCNAPSQASAGVSRPLSHTLGEFSTSERAGRPK